MHALLQSKLQALETPIDVIVVGFRHLSFAFVSSMQRYPGIRVPLIISQKPETTVSYLRRKGIRSIAEGNIKKIQQNADRGFVCVSSDKNLIKEYPSSVVLEASNTVIYGTEVVLLALNSGKHVVTINSALHVTTGSYLQKLAQKKKLCFTDIHSMSAGNLAQLINRSQMLGFTTSQAGFTYPIPLSSESSVIFNNPQLSSKEKEALFDGATLAIDTTLVANHFAMQIRDKGSRGSVITDIDDIPKLVLSLGMQSQNVITNYTGVDIPSGSYVLVTHSDPNQKKYLHQLGLGDGPYYLLFEPQRRSHFEITETIASVFFFSETLIANSLSPLHQTVTFAKKDLKSGDILYGIGGKNTYGDVRTLSQESSQNGLPIGLSFGARLLRNIPKGDQIMTSDVELPQNVATLLTGLVQASRVKRYLQRTSISDMALFNQFT